MLRLFSVGGVQREVISVPGRPVTVAGWGGRLVIVYQAGPCKLKIHNIHLPRQLHLMLYVHVHVNVHCMHVTLKGWERGCMCREEAENFDVILGS